MARDSRREHQDMLCRFRTVIQRGTHGLVHNLSLDRYDDGWIVIRGDVRSYYGAQLAIHAIKQFISDHGQFQQTQVVLVVDGRRQEYVIARAADEQTDEPVSPHIVDCQPQLTEAATV